MEPQEVLGRQMDSVAIEPLMEVVTSDKAAERGFRFRNQPPERRKCKFCGTVCYPEGIAFGREVVFWQPFPPRCTCEKATEFWEAYDRREKEKERAQAEQERQRQMTEKVNRLLGESGIKRRFMQRTFENFRRDTPGRDSSYQAAKEYADNWKDHESRGEGLYIEGTNGTGKTHLAAAVALQLIGQGIPVICKTSNDLLQDIKNSYDTEFTNEGQVLSVYKKVDLLIVDDLGKEQCSEWSMSVLYSIINERYEDMKPIIITTNYNANGLVNALAPKGGDSTKAQAIVSRLRETSRLITMAWGDIRRA